MHSISESRKWQQSGFQQSVQGAECNPFNSLNYRMKIVDDDVDWKQLEAQNEEEKEEEDDEAPVVCKSLLYLSL